MSAVGFTGTRGDLPYGQRLTLTQLLAEHFFTGRLFHSGDCVNGDEFAHHEATEIGYRTHVWPPLNRKFRAYCNGDVMHRPMMYQNRNLAIVQHSDILLACPPGTEADWPRSGTWMTVRIARRLGVPRIIINPDGTVDHDGR